MKHGMMLSLIAALAAALGCETGSKVDLGNDKVAATGEKLSDYAGDWHGYTEAYVFDDGTDSIAIKLDPKGHGAIDVGKADPLPPPDPDKGYPPGAGKKNTPGLPSTAPSTLISGFSYPISNAKVERKRIRFGTATGEVIREWCELQTPMQTDAGSGEATWLCLPSGGFSAGPDGCSAGSLPVPCGKLSCLTDCRCSQDSCEPMNVDALDVQFDAALQANGDELVGTLVIESQRVTVRMTRM